MERQFAKTPIFECRGRNKALDQVGSKATAKQFPRETICQRAFSTKRPTSATGPHFVRNVH